MVLSGVPFWEQSDQEFFDDMAGSETEEEALRSYSARGGKDEQTAHRPSQNKLALQVAEKIAKEKSEKLQLNQDLESVRERFQSLERIMSKQEM